MGRRPGITSTETRRDLLAATMTVLSQRGCAGVRVSDIATEAGVTSGAMYKHFASKHDLLLAAILEHLPDVVSHALASTSDLTIIALIRELGSGLSDPSGDLAPALLELVATAARDDAVAELVRARFSERERAFDDLIRVAQDRDEIDADLESSALARFTTMLALGSLVVAAMELEPVERPAWDAVIVRLLDAVRRAEDLQ